MAVLLRVMLVVGLRVTEATYLRSQDIDPATGRCSWWQTATAKGGKPRVVEVPTEDRDWLVQFRERGLGSKTGHLFEGRGSLAERARKRVRAACRAWASPAWAHMDSVKPLLRQITSEQSPPAQMTGRHCCTLPASWDIIGLRWRLRAMWMVMCGSGNQIRIQLLIAALAP